MMLVNLIRKLRLNLHRRNLLKVVRGGGGLRLGGVINVVAADKLTIGKNVYIGENAFLHCIGGISIGDECAISRNVAIYSYDHDFTSTDSFPFSSENILKPVEIGRRVWIGMNVSIAPGTKIGDGAIIGMGTVIRGEVPANAICVGPKAIIVAYRNNEGAPRVTPDSQLHKTE